MKALDRYLTRELILPIVYCSISLVFLILIADLFDNIDDFLKHLFHAIAVAGADHVGIGADMDGGGGVTGLEDVGAYPKITLALLRHGVSEADVEKIWGGNTLRVLRAAEAFAKKTSD